AGGQRETRKREIRERDAGVKRRVLIHAIAKRILQVVVHSESGAHHCLILSGWIPGETDSRLREEFRAVYRKCRASNARLSLKRAIHSKDERRGPSVRLVPAIRKLVAEPE